MKLWSRKKIRKRCQRKCKVADKKDNTDASDEEVAGDDTENDSSFPGLKFALLMF